MPDESEIKKAVAYVELSLTEAAVEKMQGDRSDRIAARMTRDVVTAYSKWLIDEVMRINDQQHGAEFLGVVEGLVCMIVDTATSGVSKKGSKPKLIAVFLEHVRERLGNEQMGT